jgi:hypothetical protein
VIGERLEGEQFCVFGPLAFEPGSWEMGGECEHWTVLSEVDMEVEVLSFVVAEPVEARNSQPATACKMDS